MLTETPQALPAQRYYRLLDQQPKEAGAGRSLMAGVLLAPGDKARRLLAEAPELAPEVLKAIRLGRGLQTLAEAPVNGVTDPDKLAQLVPALAGLPDQQAAPLAFNVAGQFARRGQWDLAREMYLLMMERYPAHPLSVEACRWLIRYTSSSEALHRHKSRQFLVVTRSAITPAAPSPLPLSTATGERGGGEGTAAGGAKQAGYDVRQEQGVALFTDGQKVRQWYQGSIELEPRLATFGSLYAGDPAMQFCIQSGAAP